MDTLIKIFKQNKGWLYSKSFGYNSSFYRSLNKLIASGEVVKVKSGLYKYASMFVNNEMEEVAKMYPTGVFCLFSAWQYYQLTTTVSYQYHLAFPHKAKIKLSTYPPISPYYWSNKYYHLGIETKKGVQIYTIERSVCDAVKFRNKIGEDIMLEVLKNYIKRKDKNIDVLMQYAKKLRIEKIISPYLKILL